MSPPSDAGWLDDGGSLGLAEVSWGWLEVEPAGVTML